MNINLKLYLNHLYNKTASKLNPTLFTCLFNFKALLLRLKIRIKYIGEGFYLAKDGKKERRFNVKLQNAISFERGLYMRSQDLSNAYMLDIIPFNDGDTIIDCGANIGDLTLYFEIKNIKIEYYGFEPSLMEYKCLEHNAKSKNIYNVGLWNEKTTINFFSSTSHADSSIIKPIKYDSIKTILVDRLDKIIPSEKKIKLFKLEAEGAEEEVLIGAKDILKNIEYISADLGFERGENEESTLPQVTNFLLQNGFEIVSFNGSRFSLLFRNKVLSKH